MVSHSGQNNSTNQVYGNISFLLIYNTVLVPNPLIRVQISQLFSVVNDIG